MAFFYISAPTITGSGTSSMPNASRTPSRTARASVEDVGRGGASPVGERERVPRRQGRHGIGRHAKASAKARVLDEPRGARLDRRPRGRRAPRVPRRVRGKRSPRRRRATIGIGEERARAPRVVVGVVEHHSLGTSQLQHRIAHRGRRRRASHLDAEGLSQLRVLHRRRAGAKAHLERHVDHHESRGGRPHCRHQPRRRSPRLAGSA